MILFILLWLCKPDASCQQKGAHLDVTGTGEVNANVFTGVTVSIIIKVIIYEGITSLKSGCFSGFIELVDVELPDSLLSIESSVFKNTKIVSVSFGSKLESFSNPFYVVDTIKYISISSSNPNFASEDGCLYDKTFDTLLCCPRMLNASTFKSGITKIKNFAVYNSISKTIYVPDSVKILGSQSFVDCVSTNQIIFSKNSRLEKLSSDCIYQCGISSFICPSNVTVIESNSISYCRELKRITFYPNSLLKTVSDNAFFHLEGLESVTFPAMVQNISKAAFSDCPKLIYVDVESAPEGVDVYYQSISGSLYSVGFKELIFVPPNSTELTLKNTTKVIGEGILQRCENLTSIEITGLNPKIVFDGNLIYTSDFDTALSAVGGCVSVTISDKCKKLTQYLFSSCKKLQSVIFPSNSPIENIPSSCFASSSVQSVILSPKIKTFNYYSFSKSQIRNITIPSRTTSLDGYTFSETRSLTSVTFEPDSNLTTIGRNCFYKSTLSNIILPGKLESIDYGGFCGTKITSIKLPDSIDFIGESAFSSCGELESIECTENCSLKTVNRVAFAGCVNLNSIQIPPNLLVVEKQIFQDCSSLSKVEWLGTPNVNTLSTLAFYNCYSLTTFEIPKSVSSVQTSTFSGCKSLTTLSLKDGLYYKEIDGVLFDVSGSVLSVFPPGRESYRVPKFTTEVVSLLFYDCPKLTTVIYESECLVTEVKAQTFYNCLNLAEVKLCSKIRDIRSNCFDGCTNLQTVSFADQSNVINIPVSVFTDFTNLQKVIFEGKCNLESISDSALKGCINLIVFSIGRESKLSKYGISTFEGCQRLQSIFIPSSVSQIGSRCFSGCSGLVSINFEGYNASTKSSSGLEIADSAFEDCSAVGEIHLPDNLDLIGIKVFSGCSNLKEVFYCGHSSFQNPSLRTDTFVYVLVGYGFRQFCGAPVFPVMRSCGILPTGAFTHSGDMAPRMAHLIPALISPDANSADVE